MTENNSNTKENLLFMCGHFATDLCHGSMPVILAYMYQAGRLGSYSQVALLMMANTILNAIVQPPLSYEYWDFSGMSWCNVLRACRKSDPLICTGMP